MENYHNELLRKYVQYLSDCRYTNSTINAYRRFVKEYLTNLDKPVSEVDEVKITCYLANNIMDIYHTNSARDRFVEAFILFFNHILDKNYTMFGIAGKNYEPKLPNTLTRLEIKKIIVSTTNLKHRTILSLIYFLGLKLEDLINLKLIDVNIAKNEIIIRNTEKKKLRVINISNKLCNLIAEYTNYYLPKQWLFEGRGNGKYSNRSVQLLIKNCMKRCRIEQNASPSTFRHSLATHLIENGIDLHLVKDYLGMCTVKSTKKYTQLVKIQKLNLSNAIEKGF
jgi:site-specific recombinase XerD